LVLKSILSDILCILKLYSNYQIVYLCLSNI